MTIQPSIGILEMPVGNLRSVRNALYESGFDPCFVSSEKKFDDLTHLILPGVGAFKAVMDHLTAAALSDPVIRFARSGRPLLGICAGMQLLAREGTEGGACAGLDLIDGMVGKLAPGPDLPLPHVGWSGITWRRPHPVTEGIKPGRDFYFVHSYAMRLDDPSQAIGETEYGSRFASVVGKDNVVGFQFHPEKSQANGLKLLENFGWWDGRC